MPTTWKNKTPRAFGGLRCAVKDHLYALRGGRHIYTSAWVHEGPLRRCSASIGITASRKPFEVRMGKETREYLAVAMRPMVERVLRAEDVAVVGFQFDPSHPDFPRFRRLPAPGLMSLEREAFREFDDQLNAAYRGELTTEAADDLFDRFATVALRQFPKTKPVDPRVEKVIELLWQDHRHPLADLAAGVGLSYYRLSHLFAENMGITLRHYQRWRKVRKAISLSKLNYSLTQLAHESGFTDAAHLSRVFQQLHAAPPSYFLQSQHVRIVAPPMRIDEKKAP